jgi:hypothetical protein
VHMYPCIYLYMLVCQDAHVCVQAHTHTQYAHIHRHSCTAQLRAHAETDVLILPVAHMEQARDSPDRTNLGMALSKIENVWLLSDKLERREWTRKYVFLQNTHAGARARARTHTHTHTHTLLPLVFLHAHLCTQSRMHQSTY